MAQKEGPPRKTETLNKFSTMASQNEREGTKPDEFFWLENIMRVAPHKLHSVPGPRSVDIFPPPAPPTCPDGAPNPPQAQSLPVVCCWNVDPGWKLVSSNHAGMFAHVNRTTGDFWLTISEMSGFGCGMSYDNPTPPAVCWYLLGPPLVGGIQSCGPMVERTPISFGGFTGNLGATQTTQGGSCGGGHSDELIYHLDMDNLNPKPFPIANGPGFIGPPGITQCPNVWFGESVGVNFLYASNNNTLARGAWCKFQDHLYTTRISSINELDNRFASWPLGNMITYEDQTGDPTVIWPGVLLNGTFDWLNTPMSIDCTNSFIYSLIFGPFSGGPSGVRIYKNNRSDFSYVTHWVLDTDPNFPSPWGMAVFDDSLIFLISGSGASGIDWKIGNFKTADGSTSVIGSLFSGQCTGAGDTFFADPASQNAFHYAKNYFYLSYSGRGLGVTNVIKIGPLVCPSNPALPWES